MRLVSHIRIGWGISVREIDRIMGIIIITFRTTIIITKFRLRIFRKITHQVKKEIVVKTNMTVSEILFVKLLRKKSRMSTFLPHLKPKLNLIKVLIRMTRKK